MASTEKHSNQKDIIDAERRGAAVFKARLLSAIENIFISELGPEEGNGYVLGPAFKPDTETNMLALKAWVESFLL